MRHFFVLTAFLSTVIAFSQDTTSVGGVPPTPSAPDTTSQSTAISSPQDGSNAPSKPREDSPGRPEDSARSNSSPSADAYPPPDQAADSPVLKKRQPPPKTIPTVRTVEVGTEMHATLDKQLSTKSSQNGEEFTATLTDSLKNRNGEVIVPAGSKLYGKVAESEKGKIFGSVRNSAGRLSLRFTGLQLSEGRTVPIEASLLNLEDTNGKVHARTTGEDGIAGTTDGKTAAKDIGIGAGLGTIAGLALGSALKGLALGALVGGGYILATQGRDVELPANTGLHLRLDQHLTLPAEAISGRGNAPLDSVPRQ